MNMPLKVLELETKPVDLPFDRPRQSGVVVRMGDPQAAMALLDQLLVESDPAEGRRLRGATRTHPLRQTEERLAVGFPAIKI